MTDICEEFYNYVFSFYNEIDGIYPIKGLTKKMIVSATDKYLTSVDENTTWGDGIYPIKGLTKKMIVSATDKYLTSLDENTTWGDGDSVDRERVRDIILEDNDVILWNRVL